MPLANRSARVVCAGILVADIFVPPLPGLPAAGELRATEDFLLDTGGCAANVAVGLARLGVSSSVCGVVGTDIFGDFLINRLGESGIDTARIRRTAEYGTSKTVILPVIGEDRRYIHTFGANNAFTGAEVALDALEPGDVLYIGGLLIMPALSSASAAKLCAEARVRGVFTVLDVVVPAGTDSATGSIYMAYLRPILKHADCFIPNEQEAHALTGAAGIDAQADCFLECGCKSVAITRGAMGTLFKSNDLSLHADAYPVEFVDGSGAGDAFAAGLIKGLAEQWDVRQTLTFASAVGASACTKLGCTTGIVGSDEILAMLSAHPLHITEKKG